MVKPSFLLMIPLLGISGLSACPSEDDCPACVADFAIYDPDWEDDGVWEEEVTALQTFLTTYGYDFERVSDADVESGLLAGSDGLHFRALIAPGGYAWPREVALSAAGETNIRAFVNRGGGFLSFCAGSFWAAEQVVWAEEATGGGGAYNAGDDYASYDYHLDLFPGAAQGPFGWTPWAGGTGASLQEVKLDTSLPTLAALGLPSTSRFFYYGGPFFTAGAFPPDLEVWARAVAPEGLSGDARTGAGEPSVVSYPYGEGRVVLFSYHPEILIHDDADGVTLTQAIDETTMNWDTGGMSWEDISYQSWSIVYGAVQVVTGQEVKPLPFVP